MSRVKRSYAEIEARRSPIGKLKKKFRSQRDNARHRGIAWDLSFEEWHKFWQDSGQLPNRGKGRGKYVMARFGDKGAYKLGNIKIMLGTENCREGHLGRPESPESNLKNSLGQLGRKHSLATRLKISTSNTGKKFTTEHRLALSRAAQRRFARIRTEERVHAKERA